VGRRWSLRTLLLTGRRRPQSSLITEPSTQDRTRSQLYSQRSGGSLVELQLVASPPLPLSRFTVQLAFLRLHRQVLHSNFIFQPPVSDFVSSLLEAPRTDNVLASRRTDRSANADNWFLQPPAASCEVSSPLCQLQPSQGRRFCTERVCRKQFFWKQHERSSGRDYKTINGLRLVASRSSRARGRGFLRFETPRLEAREARGLRFSAPVQYSTPSAKPEARALQVAPRTLRQCQFYMLLSVGRSQAKSYFQKFSRYSQYISISDGYI